MSEPVSSAVEAELRRRVKGDVFFDPVTRGIYATDASNYQITPVGVVVPRDDADVRSAVEIASRHGVSILPRGGGTSLSGQTAGASLVIDFSKYMDAILEVNPGQRWARVQPGVVLDRLNAVLEPHRLHFAPDPATANRCAIGGMIANNSSGTRSIRYGKTSDHVIETRALLSDGTELTFGPLSRDDIDRKIASDGREGEIYSGVREIVERNRDEIVRRFPRTMRRVSGYALDAFVNGAGEWNLSRLLIGSEGTLATLLEAKVHLEPLPAATSLVIVHFDDLLDAVGSVPPILEHGPSAVELVDRVLIVLAKEHPTLSRSCDFIDGDPQALLAVEFMGNGPADVEARARDFARAMSDRRVGVGCRIVLDPAAQARVAAVRKAGLGIVMGMKGDKKPLSFVEDAAVPVEMLRDYIADLQALCRRVGTDTVIYAHASVGVLHVKPLLNLKDAADVARMKMISDGTLELVMRYGGAWSGEHGDGLSRSAYLERFFGSQLYEAFRQVKRLFDPAGLMNPGKIVDAPPHTENLRFGASYRALSVPTIYHFREDGSFAAAVEMCSGVGACRKLDTGTMCPSYMATRDEAHSTRGRANALRLAMTGHFGPDALSGDGVNDVLDLCLACKACKSECPSRVDLARLKSEVLQMRHDRRGASLRERLIAGSPDTAARLAGRLAPVANAIQGSAPARAFLDRVAGVDRRRQLPAYARESFHAWFARRARKPGRASEVGRGRPAAGPASRTVALFADTYLDYHEPSIGRAAVKLLESCGYEVLLARVGCCQRPRITHGFLREARERGERTLRGLDEFVSRGIPVVVCEPGCASALLDDLLDLIDDVDLARRIEKGVSMIDVFLAREREAGRLDTRLVSPVRSIAIHGHCHQKALFGTEAMIGLLRQVPGLSVQEIDSGCCGMAGSFGYEKEHRDLSLKVGEDRLFPALRALDPSTTIVACGFSCRHQIDDALGRNAVHWVEVIEGTTRR